MSEKHIPPQKPYLQIKDVVKTYGENYAVDHIDLDIDRHEIFALLGSSGSGKSTLLRMLIGYSLHSSDSNAVHGLEDFFVLHTDIKREFFALFRKQIQHFLPRFRAF